MRLEELQAALARRATNEQPAATALEAQVRDRAPGVSTRLDVYTELVREAHLDALSQTFPVTAAVLGARYWRTLLRNSWEGPGSADADLAGYGGFVPDLLATAVASRPELEPLAYLPELVNLEWAVHQAIARTGPERFDWAAFAELPEDVRANVRLLPSPVLARLELAAPVDEIWRRHRGAEPSGEGDAGPYACWLHPAGGFDVGVLRWDPREHAGLDRLLEGASLASFDALGSTEGVARLHAWIEAGWIVGFERAD